MARQDEPHSFDDFDARLRRAQGERPPPADETKEGDQGRMTFGDGLQVGIEIVAGVGGGLLLGYWLDRWLDTRPLFLILFFILGAAAGTLNAFKRLRRWSAGTGP